MNEMNEAVKKSTNEKPSDSLAGRMIIEQRRLSKTPLAMSDFTVVLEEQVVMWAGVQDMSNALPFGTFQVGRNKYLQDKLADELRQVCPNPMDDIPSFDTLRQLPLLVSGRTSISPSNSKR